MPQMWMLLQQIKQQSRENTNEDAAAFKTNPTDSIIGGAKKRISTYFAPSCTASSTNQTKVSGSAKITGQKGFTLKFQPTFVQLLGPKIFIFEALKHFVEEWSQNHAPPETVLAGRNKSISQAPVVCEDTIRHI